MSDRPDTGNVASGPQVAPAEHGLDWPGTMTIEQAATRYAWQCIIRALNKNGSDMGLGEFSEIMLLHAPDPAAGKPDLNLDCLKLAVDLGYICCDPDNDKHVCDTLCHEVTGVAAYQYNCFGVRGVVLDRVIVSSPDDESWRAFDPDADGDVFRRNEDWPFRYAVHLGPMLSKYIPKYNEQVALWLAARAQRDILTDKRTLIPLDGFGDEFLSPENLLQPILDNLEVDREDLVGHLGGGFV
ncbi:hypothetical protein FZEAL_3333 [Fusarium zealandicum]|uniref:Uncharacterized protein n=1 Tax=Fusarium zealandicum TaxID=1053134 RepID=A0A8H4UNZ6_9HYPO|nr:hypothetical protein FZEAL_3333 [Fusarium zealandicum]